MNAETKILVAPMPSQLHEEAPTKIAYSVKYTNMGYSYP